MNENPNQESSLKIIQRKFLAKLQDNLGGFRKFLDKVASENTHLKCFVARIKMQFKVEN